MADDISSPPQAEDDDGVVLPVGEASVQDGDRSIARLPAASLARLGIGLGSVVSIAGERGKSFARIMLLPPDAADQEAVLLGAVARAQSGLAIGDAARIRPVPAPTATRIVLAVDDAGAAGILGLKKLYRQRLDNRPTVTGDRVKLTLVGGRIVDARVRTIEPNTADGVVMVGDETVLEIVSNGEPGRKRSVSYDELGGVASELARVQEMVELPLRRPDLFAHLGIEPPKGVLLSGPPGTGKTLIARAVAEECNAAFFQINGPEIANKHYGESEKQLRDIFLKAEKKAPSIVFIDEIDAIAPKRDSLAGDRQVERRIVGQLLTLLDGQKARGQVIVMAATNLPDALDGALRRPGRFDREIRFSPPDIDGRTDILTIHTRGMPLGGDVSLQELGQLTHGYVGADLAALAREAGMMALRRVEPALNEGAEGLDLSAILVNRHDFIGAMREIVPTALREVYSERPSTRWQDVAGHADAKAALEEAVIWPIRYGEEMQAAGVQPLRGVLLAGPPGTGKTLLAKAVANEAGANFISVRGPQLLNQYLGEAERAIRDVFAKARQAAPCIIFFDEIDAVAQKRGGAGGQAGDRVVAQLLTEMDGMEDRAGVFVLAATNRPDTLDAALLRPGRFDLAFHLGLPDEADRRDILAIHSAVLTLGKDVDLAVIAAITEGFVGADLDALCRRAGLTAFRRAVANGALDRGERPCVEQSDCLAAVEALKRSRQVAMETDGARR
ncbi:MAG: AAA family ATPase [Pseudomonadota bacterium]